jgi:hypothetical protein
MAEIAPMLINWILKEPNIILHLMSSEPIWELFDEIPASKKKRTKPGSIQDYYHFLSGLDIGIAPLKNTPFNRCRSDIKFLEFAAHGVVPVLARAVPYRTTVKDGESGFLYDTQRDMIKILDLLVRDPSLRQKVATKGRRYVTKNRLQGEHVSERISWYGKLSTQIGQCRHDGMPEDLFHRLSERNEAAVDGTYMQLTDSDFERLLGAALIDLQPDGSKRNARACFMQAAEIAPGNYLPHLFGASVSDDPEKAFRKALEMNPDSLNAWILLGDYFLISHRIKEAFECFSAATQVFPDYEVPYLRVGALLEKMGRQAEAGPFFDRARALCPNIPDQEPFYEMTQQPS